MLIFCQKMTSLISGSDDLLLSSLCIIKIWFLVPSPGYISCLTTCEENGIWKYNLWLLLMLGLHEEGFELWERAAHPILWGWLEVACSEGARGTEYWNIYTFSFLIWSLTGNTWMTLFFLSFTILLIEKMFVSMICWLFIAMDSFILLQIVLLTFRLIVMITLFKRYSVMIWLIPIARYARQFFKSRTFIAYIC